MLYNQQEKYKKSRSPGLSLSSPTLLGHQEPTSIFHPRETSGHAWTQTRAYTMLRSGRSTKECWSPLLSVQASQPENILVLPQHSRSMPSVYLLALLRRFLNKCLLFVHNSVLSRTYDANNAQHQPTNESIPAYPMMLASGGTTDLSSTPNAIGIMRNGVAMFR